MAEEQKLRALRARSFLRGLVPNTRPSQAQVQSAIRIALVVVAALLIVLLVLYLIGRRFDTTLLALLKVLAVPITVGVAVPWLNWLQKKREVEVEHQRAQDDALQAYLDQMSVMLIPSKDQPSLSDESPPESLRSVARARTLTVLSRLDGRRRGSVLQFLYESGLIAAERRILDLSGADLGEAYLVQTNLSRADLREAALVKAQLGLAYVYGADLRGASLMEAGMRQADLRKADLREAFLVRVYLHLADLSGADLQRARLFDADLSEADLEGADLRGTSLIKADLRRADLRGADLSEADLSEADLSEADLSEAQLTVARLVRADLSEAQLLGADLTKADLFQANLSGAVLSGVNLRGAQAWTEEQLRQAESLGGATMPNGQTYEDWLKDRERKEDAENE